MPDAHLVIAAGRRSVSQTLGLDQERVHTILAVSGSPLSRL